MTETLTIRLPAALARDLRAKAKAAKTNPTEVLRRAAEKYVREDHAARDARAEHVRKYAGTWDGYCSGAELLRRTRFQPEGLPEISPGRSPGLRG